MIKLDLIYPRYSVEPVLGTQELCVFAVKPLQPDTVGVALLRSSKLCCYLLLFTTDEMNDAKYE